MSVYSEQRYVSRVVTEQVAQQVPVVFHAVPLKTLWR